MGCKQCQTNRERAMAAALWKSAGSIVGYVLESVRQESEQVEADAPSTSDEQFQELVLKKTYKCLTSAQSDEPESEAAEHPAEAEER